MALKGKNEKLAHMRAEIQNGDNLGLSLIFKNTVTDKTREMLLVPHVNITMWHAAAMKLAAIIS